MEPSKEIAGGSFYTNGEFNEQLVEQLRERLSVFLRNARSSTFAALVAFVRSSGEIGGGAFTDEDISQLVATLECEDKVARIRTGSEVTYVWNQSENLRLLEGVPCIGCALVGDCSADGRVNPRDCTYLSHWLGLDVDVEPEGEEQEDA
ncbi:DNA-directed RNA polymerases 39 kda [Cyclospora cayetanensis]|nr:DNA-directed RNA polymerases 39 kda [Cyclospora cayetanensis]